MNHAADALLARNEIRPPIIVGITSLPGDARTFEYTPWTADLPSDSSGGGGDAFLAAISDTLLPLLESHYRCSHDGVCLIGASLGGLLAVYAGFKADSTFKGVAALSPNYTWSRGRFLSYLQSDSLGRPALVYHDMGTVDDNSISVLYRVSSILTDLGFIEGVDLTTYVAEGQTHNWDSWATRIPGVLRFLDRPAGTAVPTPPPSKYANRPSG